MKKFTFALVLAMLLSLTACGQSHTHSGDAWERNADQHWKVCECGEQFELADHSLDEDSRCTACGAEIQKWDKGSDLYLYDDQYNLLRWQFYDLQGNLLVDDRIDYTFDADGNILTQKCYSYDVLTEESFYEGGELQRMISYYEDGTRNECQYDEHGNIVTMVYYNTDDTVLSNEQFEYALDANGEWYEMRSTNTEADGSRYVGEYNDQGDQVLWATYAPDGTAEHYERYEVTYDDEGRKSTQKTYSFDVLVEEVIYTLVEFEDGWMNYPGTVTEYQEDGGKTVSVYDENDELVSQTVYDAAGNVVE